MITKLNVQSFKTLEDVEIELGLVNVFVGANGSGKSNLLEAVGVLSAAADGKVNDQVLLQRGVRPGLPELYKSAFPEGLPQHISFGAYNDQSSYEVTLHNPLNESSKLWRYKSESWIQGEEKLASRSPATKGNPNTELGLANAKAIAMEPVEGNGDAMATKMTIAQADLMVRDMLKAGASRKEVMAGSPGLDLLKRLQEYVVFSPTTPVLRGTAPESQPRDPIGIHGGRLPDAVGELLVQADTDEHAATVCEEVLDLIDWAKDFRSESADKVPLSAAAGASPRVIRFVDRYMKEGRNVLSGYDASEGALYVLFLAVLAAHKGSPQFCAVDNADHGLNPRLARALTARFCQWILDSPEPRQLLLTAHNPQVLDGLPLQDDRVRLFTVSRTSKGRSSIRRVEITPELIERLRDEKNGGCTLSRLWLMGHLGGVPSV